VEDVNKHKRWIIVGLGNPGLEYSKTRHNLGKMVVQHLGHELNWPFKKDLNTSNEIARGVVNGVNVQLIIPMKFMNESGRAIRLFLGYYRLSAEELIVVLDDAALPFGTLRLREFGSAGGHNGLKSIEEHVGTQRYVRLRMGIGQPKTGQDLADYVLERFSADEEAQLPEFLDKGTKALKHTIEHSVDLAMNLVNTKDC